ncbi:MAG: DUF721 domain-containing protein [Armatimonadetes bacterium]|nr:DUF721 domain-containing protein [Armatimonadota bacterium]
MRHAGKLLDKAIDRTEVLRAARAGACLRNWPSIVGDFIAEKAQPSRYDQGVLWISVAGSAWSQELRLRKLDLIERLNSAAQEKDLFTDLRFEVKQKRGEEPHEEDKGEAIRLAYRATLKGKSIQELAERRLKKQ